MREKEGSKWAEKEGNRRERTKERGRKGGVT
jgi:hypothetical protein